MFFHVSIVSVVVRSRSSRNCHHRVRDSLGRVPGAHGVIGPSRPNRFRLVSVLPLPTSCRAESGVGISVRRKMVEKWLIRHRECVEFLALRSKPKTCHGCFVFMCNRVYDFRRQVDQGRHTYVCNDFNFWYLDCYSGQMVGAAWRHVYSTARVGVYPLACQA